MSVGEICNRAVVTASVEDPVRMAAGLMRRHHVGDVIVVEEREGRRVPVGIVTDRDLVMEVVEKGVGPDVLVLGDVMTEPLLSIEEGDGLDEAIHRMRELGVRRAPVVDEAGGLVGILAMDDVLERLADELGDLSALLDRERTRERAFRPGTAG